MCIKLLTLVISLVSMQVVVLSLSTHVQSGSCSEALPAHTPTLLQVRRAESAQSSMILEDTSRLASSTNPSGAAAPLDEVGYSAVADRCCQAEMREFMKRQALNLNLDVCDEAGLIGMAPYHSCEKGPQTFADLTSNLLADSQKRCRWIAPTGSCGDKPADCPEFRVTPTADCACSRSGAANFDVAAGTVTHNNLGGVGPDSGVAELRYSLAGTTEDGVAFDLVVTALNAYKGNGIRNGIHEKFGRISLDCSATGGTTTEFRFSFVQPGTNTPVTLSEVHMAIFDLDGKDPHGVEVAASKGYKGYVTDANPSVVASRLADGRTKFSSSQAVNNVPNPTDPEAVTTEQRQSSIMYFYADVSAFEVTFGIENCRSARDRKSVV